MAFARPNRFNIAPRPITEDMLYGTMAKSVVLSISQLSKSGLVNQSAFKKRSYLLIEFAFFLNQL